MQNNNTAPQKMVRVTIRIDAELKREVFAIFKTLGVTPSDAIRGFLREVARTGKMPFSYDSVQHDA